MQLATRLAVAIVGFTITLLGVVMLVTPGPGWLMILLGLGVLSVEFVWARRLLKFTIADITAMIAIDFGKVSKIAIKPEQKNLARWHAEVAARPSARARGA